MKRYVLSRLHPSNVNCVLTNMFAGVAAAHKQDADCLAHQGQRPSAVRDWFHRAQEELPQLQPDNKGMPARPNAFLARMAANVARNYS